MAGQTAGLRPSQRRSLDQLCHRRHPTDAVADLLTLQRLADLARDLQLPLSLVIDGRGLSRLLWVGDLVQSGRLIEKLPGSARRRGSALRLVSCTGHGPRSSLQPGQREAVVALDLEPCLWLRYPHQAGAGGRWPASLFVPSSGTANGWGEAASSELALLCNEAPDGVISTADDRPEAVSIGDEERVLLLVLTSADPQRAQRHIAELEGLVRSAGAVPVGVISQRRGSGAAPGSWGEGKVREAALEARRLQADLVVADRDLTPVQARNLERTLDLPVSDRTELILDIFAQRAASGAGRLQVELAQLRYRLPRLSGRGQSLSRQGGGIGSRGPGETQLEKDRRAIARRIDHLQRAVRRLGEHRARLRQSRSQQRRLALVGYTNAGKSSLLNALTRAGSDEAVLAENKLFATLDPTTRRLDLPEPQGAAAETVLITDTVGFIRELPPPLIEAFRSTFEEALDADGLLIVVDLSDPGWPEQLSTVEGILDGLDSVLPRLVIGNQIDRCPAAELERAQALEPGMLFVSATANLGLQGLRLKLRHWPVPPAAMPTSAG